MERFIFMVRTIGGIVLAVAMFFFLAGLNGTAVILIGVAGFCIALAIALQLSGHYHNYFLKRRRS